MHHFHRLGTTPATHSPPSTSAATFQEENIRRRRRNTGGVYSTRSQVRAPVHTAQDGDVFMPAGARVDLGPLTRSESASAEKSEGNLKATMHSFTRIQKRSYKRALRRAQTEGSTMYRGRRRSRAVHLPCDSSVPGSVKPSKRSRLEVITWNVDGLSDILYAEIKHWLNNNCTADILMLQETHWNFTGEWSESGWNFCHSSSGRRGSGGVLVAVRESSFPAALVKWQEVAPGHMLHLRGECGLQQVDVLCVYQHALTLKDQNESGVMKKRALLWKQLDKWLGSMPIRSELIIAGDFNLTRKPFMKVCGHGVPDRDYPTQIKEEQVALLDCLTRHKLCAANTWGRRREAHTYRHPTGNTQIDYVITRQSLSDAQTKRSSPFRTTLAGWRKAGHLPVKCLLPLRWTPWKAHRPQGHAYAG